MFYRLRLQQTPPAGSVTRRGPFALTIEGTLGRATEATTATNYPELDSYIVAGGGVRAGMLLNPASPHFRFLAQVRAALNHTQGNPLTAPTAMTAFDFGACLAAQYQSSQQASVAFVAQAEGCAGGTYVNGTATNDPLTDAIIRNAGLGYHVQASVGAGARWGDFTLLVGPLWRRVFANGVAAAANGASGDFELNNPTGVFDNWVASLTWSPSTRSAPTTRPSADALCAGASTAYVSDAAITGFAAQNSTLRAEIESLLDQAVPYSNDTQTRRQILEAVALLENPHSNNAAEEAPHLALRTRWVSNYLPDGIPTVSTDNLGTLPSDERATNYTSQVQQVCRNRERIYMRLQDEHDRLTALQGRLAEAAMRNMLARLHAPRPSIRVEISEETLVNISTVQNVMQFASNRGGRQDYTDFTALLGTLRSDTAYTTMTPTQRLALLQQRLLGSRFSHPSRPANMFIPSRVGRSVTIPLLTVLPHITEYFRDVIASGSRIAIDAHTDESGRGNLATRMRTNFDLAGYRGHIIVALLSFATNTPAENYIPHSSGQTRPLIGSAPGTARILNRRFEITTCVAGSTAERCSPNFTPSTAEVPAVRPSQPQQQQQQQQQLSLPQAPTPPTAPTTTPTTTPAPPTPQEH
ncbi:MAG: hypothetical protein HQM15_06685 [Deltaproteobacteria bacterium]|nr:hypothetical protein [Deltaproteobacteria bacterium]